MTADSNVRTIPTVLLDTVRGLVAKLNKRAAKIGVEPFVLTIGQAYTQQRHRGQAFDGMPLETYTIEVADITITGAAIKVGGHELVGRVDFEDGLTIVNTRPGADMPAAYRKATTFCEHCNSQRKRNAVFVFKRETGEHLQVGRTCLQDFLGHDPEQALWAIREAGRLMGDIDEECERGAGRSAPVIAPLEVLAAAVRSVREHGFVSKAREAEELVRSTASDVFDILFPGKTDKPRPATEEDREKAAAVLAWVIATMGAKENRSDYEHNAVELCSAERVSLRRIAILASLVSCYDRASEERVAREAAVNAHVGTVGQRTDFEAVYSGEHIIDTQYGALYIGRFQTPAGLLVYKGANPFWPASIRAGDAVKFKATIKGHDEYKGTKQTMVARCKLAAA